MKDKLHIIFFIILIIIYGYCTYMESTTKSDLWGWFCALLVAFISVYGLKIFLKSQKKED